MIYLYHKIRFNSDDICLDLCRLYTKKGFDNMKKKLVIFDMDGVITSTNKEHFDAWKMLFDQHFDIDIDPKYETFTKGVSRKKSLEILLEKHDITIGSQEKIAQLLEEKNMFYQQKIEQFGAKDQAEGIKELLDFFKAENLRIALGSASKNAPMLLKKLGLLHYFDYIVDPTHLKSKPHPDIFIDANTHFGIDSKACFAIEDAVSGVDAIKNAQMYAIGVGDEDLSRADWHVKTIKDIDFQILKKVIEG